MATLAWPAALKPSSFGFTLENADQSGGAGLLGNEQFVGSPGPRWRASGRFSVKSKDQVLALRSLLTQLDGRFNDIALPAFDGKRLSWPVDARTGVVLHPGVTREKVLDGTVYEYPEIPTESEIIAALNALAALRATTVAINVSQGGTPFAGQQFGIGQRLYQIGNIVSTVGSVTTVTIRPPLRAPASAGTAVLFTRPVCLMKLMNAGDALRQLDAMRFASPDLDFVESF